MARLWIVEALREDVGDGNRDPAFTTRREAEAELASWAAASDEGDEARLVVVELPSTRAGLVDAWNGIPARRRVLRTSTGALKPRAFCESCDLWHRPSVSCDEAGAEADAWSY